MTMQGRTTGLFYAFGFADMAIGVCGMLLCFLSGFFYEGFRFLIPFGSEFWAFVSLPVLVLACGIMIIAKAGNRDVFSVFISLIAAIYLAASIFSMTPPAIVNIEKISPVALDIFKIFLPGTGAVFFIFQAVLSYLHRKIPADS